MSNNGYMLGIESSGLVSGISLARQGRLIAEFSLAIKNVHSRSQAGMVSQVLRYANVDLQQIEALALSAGPGSFTGLRIGYSLAKGLAHPANTPVVQVPTLEVFAFQQGQTALPVLSLIDAHRGDVFAAWYRWQAAGQLQQEGKSRLLPLPALNELVTEPSLIVGPDTEKLRPDIESACGSKAVFPFPLLGAPQAWAFQWLAYQKYLAGDFETAETCQPLYMRAFKGVM